MQLVKLGRWTVEFIPTITVIKDCVTTVVYKIFDSNLI